MFFSSLVTTLCLAGAVLATPYKRFDGLTVELSGPAKSVDSIDNLKFTATVKNTGAESVKILKYATILDDKLPTRSFTVKKDGATVPFTGIKLSVSLNELDDTAFTVIPAGEAVTVQHDIASLFDFASMGTGTFSFEPITNFKVLGAADDFKGVESFSKIQATANAMTVEVTKDIAKRELPQLNKRAVDICTTSSKKSFIDASYTEGKALASGAISYINSNGANALYQAYWGATSTSRVTSVLSAVANENSSSRTLSCVDSYGACSNGVIAYTVISTTNIYYCSIFFNEVPSTSLCSGTSVASRNVRGGTTLHELTHAVAGTDDVTYGCAADQALSDSQAVINADNYNCFTTQVYADTRC
ncbi:putative secreted metalloproteinase that allows assimilation of proteinaceous substrates [Lyophyllum shimeji]|uniref:Neutral protease 2 n=1 Tax=Lyophyllum shimeji TaxID=47721 RepID=A0A9P3UII6_LYOSH|nr:putative secreted metalloproteinase that allows assimilation of proteinaceous substrates [Lyophyllum shimeji]